MGKSWPNFGYMACEDLSCCEEATHYDDDGIPLCKFHYDDLEPIPQDGKEGEV